MGEFRNNLGNILTENMNIVMSTKTHLYEKGGHVFYNVTSVKIDYTIDGLKLRLDNLFEGVKVLGKATDWNILERSFCLKSSSPTFFYFQYSSDRGQHQSVFEWELETSFWCVETNYCQNNRRHSSSDAQQSIPLCTSRFLDLGHSTAKPTVWLEAETTSGAATKIVDETK